MKKLLCLIALVSSQVLGFNLVFKHAVDLKYQVKYLYFNSQDNKLAASLSFDEFFPSEKIAIISDFEKDSYNTNYIKYSDKNANLPKWNYNGDFLAINFSSNSGGPFQQHGRDKFFIEKSDGSWKKELSVTESVQSFAWNPTEKLGNFLAYRDQNSVYITDVFNDKPEKIITVGNNAKACELTKIAWSPDGKKLAIAIDADRKDGRIFIMTTEFDGEMWQTKLIHELKKYSSLNDFTWGPNGFLAASFTCYPSFYFEGCKLFGEIIFYDTESGKEVGYIDTSSHFVSANHLAWKDKYFAMAGFGGPDQEKVLFYTINFELEEKLHIFNENKN